MGLITRFYGPNSKGSKLTIKEMDDNLYYLQSFGVSGVTYQNNVLTLINPTGGTNTVIINDFYTTGATYNNGIIYFDRNDQLSAYTVNISSLTGDSNTFVTGFTYDNTSNKLTISNNNNTSFDSYIDSFSGLTINGNLSVNTISATTYQNLPLDVFVTGGTFNPLNKQITFNGNFGFNPFSVNLSGLSTDNFYTTGATLNGGIIEFSRNDTANAYSVDLNSLKFTGNTSGNCITDLYVTNVYGCSPVNIQTDLNVNGSVSATTYYGDGSNLSGISTQDIYVTGGTFSNGTASFTNNIGGTFNVTGFTTGNTLQQVLVNGNTSGGNDIIMSENDNIIFKYAGYNNNINTNPLTSNRVILFPDNSGTVALLSDIQTFTGGTVSGVTNFTNGLTANTISATNYLNLPIPNLINSGPTAPGSAVVANPTNVNVNFSDGIGTAWSFSPTGMTFPDDTIQTTAYTGGTSSVPTLYLLEAYADVTYTLPGGFTEDICRYSIVNNTVNVPSGWFNTSTYRFTPQKVGYWEITATYDVYRGSNVESSLAIRKNGGVVTAVGSFGAVSPQVTKIVYLNGSTDYVDAFNTGGASLSRNQYLERSWFQARWVGE